jgi:hypothetical protein
MSDLPEDDYDDEGSHLYWEIGGGNGSTAASPWRSPSSKPSPRLAARPQHEARRRLQQVILDSEEDTDLHNLTDLSDEEEEDRLAESTTTSDVSGQSSSSSKSPRRVLGGKPPRPSPGRRQQQQLLHQEQHQQHRASDFDPATFDFGGKVTIL